MRRFKGMITFGTLKTFWIVLLCMLSVVPGTGFAQHWGDLQNNGCTSVGTRTFASRIWDIPPNKTWEQACRSTPATIEGRLFPSPARCNDKGLFGEWGEWDVDDDSCRARWGDFKDNGCSALGTRTFASRIWDIPPGQTWDSACRTTPATILGTPFASPARCNDKGVSGEWGEWDVRDNSCRPHWGDLQNNGCTGVDKRTFASRIWDIPPGQTWDAACRTTPAIVPGSSPETPSSLPARCNDKGAFGEWGEWDVYDRACRAHWGDFQDGGCTSEGTRTFASRIWEVPPGQSWEAACKSTPAFISNHAFQSPARCNDKGAFGEWGEWDVADKTCFPSCPYVLFDPPPSEPIVGIAPTFTGNGYWLAATDGSVYAFGDAQFLALTGHPTITSRIAGIAGSPTDNGGWLVAADGNVFNFGKAALFGSLHGVVTDFPAAGIAPTPSGRGYWLVTTIGKVTSFGDAKDFGSLNTTGQVVTAIVATATGKGYWLVGKDGSLFPFGDAKSLTPSVNRPISLPVVAASANASRSGLVIAAANSDVKTFGDATFRGACTSKILPKAVSGVAATRTGNGYWLVDAGGGVFPFGDAQVSFPASQGAKQAPRMTAGNKIRVIFDGVMLFEDIATAIKNARTSINILQLIIDPRVDLEFGSFEDDRTPLFGLLELASSRGVRVRILIDRFAEYTKLQERATSLQDKLSSEAAKLSPESAVITVRDFPIWEPGRLHSKAIIIDGATAYIMGATFEQEMFDDTSHPVMANPEEARDFKEPLHTESVKIQGPGAADVEGFFAELWNANDTKYYGGVDQITTAMSGTQGKDTIQIVRTVPPAVGVGPPTGEMEILEAYQRAFANAQHFIYVENQYLLFRPILEAIRSAMDRNPNLQVILLLNQNPDQEPLKYREWQARAIRDILGPPSPQLGIFSLWSLGSGINGKTRIRRTYMEGKLTIVDDMWMTLGTANLDGLSMAAFETEGNSSPSRALLPLQPLINSKRSMELNAVVFERTSFAPNTGFIRSVRCDAWMEHLGSAGLPTCQGTAPPGGWLSVWNMVANDNVNSLNARPPGMSGRILPWVPGGILEAESQLRALGVDTSSLDIRQDP